MPYTTQDEIFEQLPTDIDNDLEGMLVLLLDAIPRLPEFFECSMLYESEEWERMDKGDRIQAGHLLSRLAHQPWSPIMQDSFTTQRHNRYRRK